MYRYLLQPGEEHDDQRHRAMDRVWSKRPYRLREIIEDAGNHVMYYLCEAGPQGLLNGPKRAFVSEELMKIQSCLLITFRNGNIYSSWIDVNCELSFCF